MAPGHDHALGRIKTLSEPDSDAHLSGGNSYIHGHVAMITEPARPVHTSGGRTAVFGLRMTSPRPA